METIDLCEKKLSYIEESVMGYIYFMDSTSDFLLRLQLKWTIRDIREFTDSLTAFELQCKGMI